MLAALVDAGALDPATVDAGSGLTAEMEGRIRALAADPAQCAAVDGPSGNSALHVAARRALAGAVRLLLAGGARPAANRAGELPSDAAAAAAARVRQVTARDEALAADPEAVGFLARADAVVGELRRAEAGQRAAAEAAALELLSSGAPAAAKKKKKKKKQKKNKGKAAAAVQEPPAVPEPTPVAHEPTPEPPPPPRRTSPDENELWCAAVASLAPDELVRPSDLFGCDRRAYGLFETVLRRVVEAKVAVTRSYDRTYMATLLGAEEDGEGGGGQEEGAEEALPPLPAELRRRFAALDERVDVLGLGAEHLVWRADRLRTLSAAQLDTLFDVALARMRSCVR